jgi:DNA polymerase-3 subunit gamma/tau
MSEQPYEVTARKYRPQTFEAVVGQEHVTRMLQNALRTKQVSHAFLFAGPRGTGKTTTARLLAKALNCRTATEMTPEPCGECESCRAIAQGSSMDVLEIDGASNRGIDQIRELRETIGYASFEGRFKVYIIDEVHMLTKEAFNALLKTLEEPPRHVVFVFATTEPGKVLPTILSRVQRYDFRRIGVVHITQTLVTICEREKIRAEREALQLIARKADGSLRDAESLLDQVRTYAGDEITLEDARQVLAVVDTERLFELTGGTVRGDAAETLRFAGRLADAGQDPYEFLLSYGEHLRHLIAAAVGGAEALETLPDTEREKYLKTAATLPAADWLRRFDHVSRAAQNLRSSPQPWIALEVALLQLAHLARAVDLKALIDRIDGALGGEDASSSGGGSAGRGPGRGGRSEGPDSRGAAPPGGVRLPQPVRAAAGAGPGPNSGPAPPSPGPGRPDRPKRATRAPGRSPRSPVRSGKHPGKRPGTSPGRRRRMRCRRPTSTTRRCPTRKSPGSPRRRNLRPRGSRPAGKRSWKRSAGARSAWPPSWPRPSRWD